MHDLTFEDELFLQMNPTIILHDLSTKECLSSFSRILEVPLLCDVQIPFIDEGLFVESENQWKQSIEEVESLIYDHGNDIPNFLLEEIETILMENPESHLSKCVNPHLKH
jgi:hypothetical protein